MSRELVEAVVAAAKHHGIVAVLVSGEHNGNGAGAVAPPPGAPGDADARYAAASARAQELENHLGIAKHNLANVTQERDTYSARLREAEAKIRSGGAPAAAGSPIPTAPNLDGQSISILGLDEEEIAKKVVKKGFDTVGKLREALLNGKLASDVKLSKDRIIAVGEALLGKAPPATLPGGGGSPVPSATAAPAAGVPAGHNDRPWTERIAAARKKERQRAELAGTIQGLNAKLATTTDQVIRGQIEAEIRTKTGTLDVIGGQVFCLLWACGLYSNPATAPKQTSDVSTDNALKDAGLVHLMETPPAPQDAPATPPPAATA